MKNEVVCRVATSWLLSLSFVNSSICREAVVSLRGNIFKSFGGSWCISVETNLSSLTVVKCHESP